jgi:catechol 2,3-dioxygenase
MTIPAGTRIGHVHLKVADIDRALKFYCGVLGFELMQRFGPGAAFISAGGYHHHIGLNTWESKGGPPPAGGTTGLYHLAILYPTRADLGTALKGLIENGVQLDGAADHGVSERCTCAILTRMGWNCTGTGPRSSGRARRTAGLRCTRGLWIWKGC